jgi:hypothetical protein
MESPLFKSVSLQCQKEIVRPQNFKRQKIRKRTLILKINNMETTNYFNITGLVALNSQEIETIQGGGIIGRRFWGYVADFIDGFIEGYNSPK